MNWTTVLIVVLVVSAVVVIAVYGLMRILRDREPYASVLRLRTRQKLRFFRYMATDSRVPKLVKFVPVLLALYLALPFDLIPDFIPVLGYIDDVGIVIFALALMVRFAGPVTVNLIIDRTIASELVDELADAK